jgi:hypothetical protein
MAHYPILSNFILSGGSKSLSGVTYTNLTPTPVTIGGIAANSTFSAKTMQEMWDLLLYPYQPPAFSSFSLGIPSPLEIGYGIPTSQTFTWSTTNSQNVSANTISIAGDNLTTLTGLPDDGSEAVNFTSVVTRGSLDGPGTLGWNIEGTNTKGVIFNTTLTIRWDWRIYVGSSASESLTETEIVSLSVFDSVKNGFSGTYSFPAAGDTYKYICYADTYGQPSSFIAGGFPVAMWSGYPNSGPGAATYDLVSVTNIYGQSINYRVYRTSNKINGAVNIVVS